MRQTETGLVIDKNLFRRYYQVDLKRLGSMRKVAEAVGVSHTQIGNMLNDRHKTHVNIETARRFEEFFGAPRGTIFFTKSLHANM